MGKIHTPPKLLVFLLGLSGCLGFDLPAQPPPEDGSSAVSDSPTGTADVLSGCFADIPCSCFSPLADVMPKFGTRAKVNAWIQSSQPEPDSFLYEPQTAVCPDGRSRTSIGYGFSDADWYFDSTGVLVGYSSWTDAMMPPCEGGSYRGDLSFCPMSERRWELDPTRTIQAPLDPALAATVTQADLIESACTSAYEVWSGTTCAPNVLTRVTDTEWDVWLFDQAGKLQTLLRTGVKGKRIFYGAIPDCLTNPNVVNAFRQLPAVHLCHNHQKL